MSVAVSNKQVIPTQICGKGLLKLLYSASVFLLTIIRPLHFSFPAVLMLTTLLNGMLF